MPSTDGTPAGHGAGSERPDPPAETGKHGDEAAKWLYRDLMDEPQTVLSIIEGMVDPERVQAWLETEVSRGDIDTLGDPRQRIIAELNARKQVIEAGDVLQPDEWAANRTIVREDRPEQDESGEVERPTPRRVTPRATSSRSSPPSTSGGDTSEESELGDFAVAADGGDTDG